MQQLGIRDMIKPAMTQPYLLSGLDKTWQVRQHTSQWLGLEPKT